MGTARTRVKVATAAMTVGLFGAALAFAPGVGAAKPDNAGGPAGNNGTVKIDGLGPNDGPGHSTAPNDPADDFVDNDPHVEECGFEVEFFNFDEGQIADVTFTVKPPTGRAITYTDPGLVISDDGTAGAANDLDLVKAYDLSDLFTALKAHDQHGFHVKLSLDISNADGSKVPGGVKHKVFWVDGDCSVAPSFVS